MTSLKNIKAAHSITCINKLILLIILCLFLSVHSNKALASDDAKSAALYKVDKIDIDVTAKSASTARKLALRNARKRAFYIVVDRITQKSEKSKLKSPTSQELIGMVRDMAILSEKTSSVRYIATVSINFKPDEIRKYITSYEVGISEADGDPVLIIPIFRPSKNANIVLWENENKWRYTWERLKKTSTSLIPKQTPIGDLEDIQTLSPEDAENLKFSAFEKMAQRYGVNDVYIVAAELVENSEQGKNLFITIIKKDSSGAQKWRKFQVSSIDPVTKKVMTLAELLKRAAQSTSNIIDDNWKKTTSIRFDKDSKLLALVNLTQLSDWILVKKFLDTSKLIDNYDLQAIKKSKAQILINYSGGLIRLQKGLKLHNIKLEMQGGIGIITPNVDAATIKDIQISINDNLVAQSDENNDDDFNDDDLNEAIADDINNDNVNTYNDDNRIKASNQPKLNNEATPIPPQAQPQVQAQPQQQQQQQQPQQYYYYEQPSAARQQYQPRYQRPQIKSSTSPNYYQAVPRSNLQPIEE